jgi:UDP-glucose 4-epimerase
LSAFGLRDLQVVCDIAVGHLRGLSFKRSLVRNDLTVTSGSGATSSHVSENLAEIRSLG